MWNFHSFSITQILREINFGEAKSAKSSVLNTFRGSEPMNFDFYALLHFLKFEGRNLEN